MTPSSSLSEEDLRPKIDPETGIDLSLIEENLRLTPWERVLANDDTINFVDMLREGLACHQKPRPIRPFNEAHHDGH